MPVLTPSEAAGYAKGAGFTGNDVVIAVAVMYAESGGHYADSATVQKGGYGRGPMQVDLGQHPGQYDEQKLINDPAYNFKAAYDIFKHGTGWHGWTTHDTGAYLQYMPQAMSGAGAAAITSGPPAPGGATPPAGTTPSSGGSHSSGLDSISSAFTHLLDGKFWIRVGEGALGLIAVIIGMWFLLPKDAQGNIERAVTAVAL